MCRWNCRIFSMDTVREMMEMSYIDRAKTVLRTFLTDFSDEELNYCVEGAYRADKFSSPAVAPTVNIGGKENILELWHGPTCAFKDMALQLLPYLMTVSAKKDRRGQDHCDPGGHLRRYRQGGVRGL